MIIGLTGGIASGKSLAAACFRELGVPVIDTDDIARQVVAPGHPAWHRILEAFGPEIIAPDGHIDRASLAKRVFHNDRERHLLESITHPEIFAEVDRQIARLRRIPAPPPLIVVVVPLLFEVGAAGRFDRTVLVKATPEQQLSRMQQSRGYTREEAEARMQAQLPLVDKEAMADVVLDNTGSPAALCRQVAKLVALFKQ